jgi:predicted ATP-dependent endonuclease of OLD family
MLKRIRAKYFRSHEDTTLDFAPGLNGIIGSGQSGKTNLLRALFLVKNYRPLGFRYHSDFTDEEKTSVHTIFDDADIYFEKGKESKSAKYKLNGKTFSTLNRQVPDEVINAINMDSLNIHDEYSPPFLITSSASEISKAINQATRMENIDKWKRKLRSKILGLKKWLQVLKTDVQDIELELTKFKNLKQIEDNILSVERTERSIDKLSKKYFKVQNLAAEINDSQSVLSYYKDAKEVLGYIKEIEKFEKDIRKLKDKKELLMTINLETNQIALAREELATKIKKYGSLLKKKKKCPTCFHSITGKDVKRITNELRLIK